MRYSRLVPLAEITDPKNNYNLNIPRYIDSSALEDLQDLHAHLHGGIPDRDLDALSSYWEAFPTLRAHLFKPNRPGYSDLAIETNQVHPAVLDSPEFKSFSASVRQSVEDWFAAHRPALAVIDSNTRPNDLIACLGDDLLLNRFKAMPLLDPYDIYEQLLTYWHETMHDDVAMIMSDGWLPAAMPRKAIEDKERSLTETPDLVIGSGKSAAKYKMDLIPPHLIVARYFANQQAEISQLTTKAGEATRAVEEYAEEHAVEEGLLSAAMDDDKISRALAAKRLKEAKQEGTDPDEVKALQHLISLYDAEAAARKAVRDAQASLDEATLRQYGNLAEADIQSLVLDHKWGTTVTDRIRGEVSALARALVTRIRQLGERYATTVGALNDELDTLEAKVACHLVAMGLKP